MLKCILYTAAHGYGNIKREERAGWDTVRDFSYTKNLPNGLKKVWSSLVFKLVSFVPEINHILLCCSIKNDYEL